MKLVLLLAVGMVCAPALDRDTELSVLHERAQTILKQSQSLEITLEQARRRVQLLLQDMQGWAKAHAVELRKKTHTYAAPRKKYEEPLTTDHCPLFFEEKLNELCPLDLAHSEVWGGEAVFCRYYCE